MTAVSRSETPLCDEILSIIAGSDEPMCCRDIYDKSKQAVDTLTLSREVNLMKAKDGLLEIADTKKREGFRQVAFYRLTDLGQKRLRELDADVIATKVKPNAAIKQEKNMTTTEPEKTSKRSNGELSSEILRKIVAQPGILKDELIQHASNLFPGAPYKQIAKCIWDMVNTSRKVRQEGAVKNRVYYPVDATVKGASKPVEKQEVKPAKKAATPPPVIDKPVHVVSPTCAKKQVAEDSEFELMLSDDNYLYISLGDEQFRLNPHQLARLDTFLARVLPDGVRYPDGARA